MKIPVSRDPAAADRRGSVAMAPRVWRLQDYLEFRPDLGRMDQRTDGDWRVGSAQPTARKEHR